MFQTKPEFQDYLDWTSKQCPTAPAMWEEITVKMYDGRPDVQTCCRGWLRVIPDYELLARYENRPGAIANLVKTDCARRLGQSQVRVQPCTRWEATHIELMGSGIVWLGRVTGSGKTKNGVSPDRIEQDEAQHARFLRDAHLDQVTARAR